VAASLEFAPFDVVVVPFPYSDALVEKRRPAVVVSTSELLKREGLLWLAMITSSSRKLHLGDRPLADLAIAGLNVPCRVRPAKLATLDRSRVLRRTGRLAPEDREAVMAGLRACGAFCSEG
jgi:mRNA interferase MazF